MEVETSMSEILVRVLAQSYMPEEQAKDIENIILMFIDWLVKEVQVKLTWEDGVGYVKKWLYSPAGWREAHCDYYAWTTSELFVHWYEKIYKKS